MALGSVVLHRNLINSFVLVGLQLAEYFPVRAPGTLTGIRTVILCPKLFSGYDRPSFCQRRQTLNLDFVPRGGRESFVGAVVLAPQRGHPVWAHAVSVGVVYVSDGRELVDERFQRRRRRSNVGFGRDVSEVCGTVRPFFHSGPGFCYASRVQRKLEGRFACIGGH